MSQKSENVLKNVINKIIDEPYLKGKHLTHIAIGFQNEI